MSNEPAIPTLFRSNENFNRELDHDCTSEPVLIFSLPKLKGFKIAFVNIVSLPKCLDELHLRMQSQTLDVLALSETRLDNTFTDSAVSIEGYTLLRRDRCRSGGGVAMYIHNVIEYKTRSDLSDPDLEFLCIEIQKPKAKPFLLSNWYRPPNSPIELFDKFEVLIGKIEAENIESNILGDINCDMMAVTPTNETRHLIELCESYQYAQLIKEPTRVTSSSKSLIDLFLTNEPGKFGTTGVSHIGCSDRSLIYVSRKLTCTRSLPRIFESRQYKNFMPADFMNDMALVPWDTIEQIDNPIRAWEVWKQSFLAVANLHEPVKKRRVRSTHRIHSAKYPLCRLKLSWLGILAINRILLRI